MFVQDGPGSSWVKVLRLAKCQRLSAWVDIPILTYLSLKIKWKRGLDYNWTPIVQAGDALRGESEESIAQRKGIPPWL